jgi:hypothetical protein
MPQQAVMPAMSQQGSSQAQPLQYQRTVDDLTGSSGPTHNAPPVHTPALSSSVNATFVPPEKPRSQSQAEINHADTKHKFADELPPSKLLNSVPEEPGKGHTLRRLDSQTHIEDEFHDAIS